jgi:hypothetical protein
MFRRALPVATIALAACIYDSSRTATPTDTHPEAARDVAADVAADAPADAPSDQALVDRGAVDRRLDRSVSSDRSPDGTPRDSKLWPDSKPALDTKLWPDKFVKQDALPNVVTWVLATSCGALGGLVGAGAEVGTCSQGLSRLTLANQASPTSTVPPDTVLADCFAGAGTPMRWAACLPLGSAYVTAGYVFNSMGNSATASCSGALVGGGCACSDHLVKSVPLSNTSWTCTCSAVAVEAWAVCVTYNLSVVQKSGPGTAPCDSGYEVIGGGCDCGSEYLLTSTPASDFKAWICECPTVTGTAYALCAK